MVGKHEKSLMEKLRRWYEKPALPPLTLPTPEAGERAIVNVNPHILDAFIATRGLAIEARRPERVKATVESHFKSPATRAHVLPEWVSNDTWPKALVSREPVPGQDVLKGLCVPDREGAYSLLPNTTNPIEDLQDWLSDVDGVEFTYDENNLVSGFVFEEAKVHIPQASLIQA